jgi:uncharacterized protein (DUF488 family)
MAIQIFTIGFAATRAASFFSLLRAAGATRIIDVRLNNRSQLAGFTKRDDLPFFLRELCDMDYIQMPHLAPTQDLLDAFKKRKGSWPTYESAFKELMRSRLIEERTSRELAHLACLLCSEKQPDHCHRRLVAEYLQEKWPDVHIRHLT